MRYLYGAFLREKDINLSLLGTLSLAYIKKGTNEKAQHVHESKALEILWTIIPTIVVIYKVTGFM